MLPVPKAKVAQRPLPALIQSRDLDDRMLSLLNPHLTTLLRIIYHAENLVSTAR